MRDELILRKIKRGDPAALEELMARYIPYVSAVVWNILRYAMGPEDAEEVVSDVFLALGYNLKKRWMKQQKKRLETHYSEKKVA